MTFTIATYNVLATAYLKPAWYPFTPKELLQPNHHIAAVVDHLVQLRPEILCLQETEDALFAAAIQRLSPLGYSGELTKKGLGKPDGCATFFQTGSFERIRAVRLQYHDEDDGRSPSGHIAQILVLNARGHFLGIANTHLKWDPPNTPPEQGYGYRQIRQLLGAHRTLAPECSGWIICGDLNATPESDVVNTLREAGFKFSHVSCSEAATCNSNRRAKMIDYIFHNGAMRAEPAALAVVEDDAPLPNPDQPSDHVAVMARCTWI